GDRRAGEAGRGGEVGAGDGGVGVEDVAEDEREVVLAQARLTRGGSPGGSAAWWLLARRHGLTLPPDGDKFIHNTNLDEETPCRSPPPPLTSSRSASGPSAGAPRTSSAPRAAPTSTPSSRSTASPSSAPRTSPSTTTTSSPSAPTPPSATASSTASRAPSPRPASPSRWSPPTP